VRSYGVTEAGRSFSAIREKTRNGVKVPIKPGGGSLFEIHPMNKKTLPSMKGVLIPVYWLMKSWTFLE
jgi:hypothetical protein